MNPFQPISIMWREHEEREAARSAWAAKLDAQYDTARKAHALDRTLKREASGYRFDWYRVDDLVECTGQVWGEVMLIVCDVVIIGYIAYFAVRETLIERWRKIRS